jgi:flagellar protein FlaH
LPGRGKCKKDEKLEYDMYLMDLEQDGLHVQLSRGIPKGCMMLIEGENGSGKSALCQRLAYSFLKHGHTVTYISTELTTKGFLDQMNSLGYPSLDFLLERRLLFVPVYPLIGRIIERKDFSKRLIENKALYENDIVIVDTFSSLVKDDINTKNDLEIISFFKKLAGKSKSFIVTIDPTELKDDLKMPFRASSDIYISLKTRQIGGNIEHSVYVNRFAGSKSHVGDMLGFRIEAGVGFIVDITTVA